MIEVIITFIGVFIFLFVFWKRLKEDYITNQVFSVATLVLIGIGIANIISRFYFNGWWFWMAFTGSFIGVIAGIIKYRLRFFEVVEAFVIALLPWLGLTFLALAFNTEVKTVIFTGIIVLLIIIFGFLDSRYKTFTWYRSGRIGFSGLTVLGLFFLIRAAVAVFLPNMVSFVGREDSILSAVIAFLSFFGLFNISRVRT